MDLSDLRRRSSPKVARIRKRGLLGESFRYSLVIICTMAILPGDALSGMPSPLPAQTTSPQAQAAKIPVDQLNSLVAPIALYPDKLLAQTLVASTYPLELIQLQQWLIGTWLSRFMCTQRQTTQEGRPHSFR